MRVSVLGAILSGWHSLSVPSRTHSRHTTAAQDILQHRVANLAWDDDWVFGDPRFRLADGPDQVLLDFLAYMAHPLVRPDISEATRLVTSLNAILAPDGRELRTSGFISGRPVYAASRTVSGPGRMIRLEVEDDDAGKLDIVLGQAHHLLGENGDDHAQRLIAGTALTLRRDGGYFHPIPGDNWTDATFEAVLTATRLRPEFTTEVTDRIWEALRAVLTHHGRGDVQSLVIEQAAPPLPAVAADWRNQAAQAFRQAPSNQARRERAEGGYPACDGLVFGSQAELAVYQALVDIQRDSRPQNSFAVLPLPGAKLRDTAVRTPDLVVIGKGRAAIIEVDGPRHYARTRKADDQDRDRHWDRYGVHTIRIPSERCQRPRVPPAAAAAVGEITPDMVQAADDTLDPSGSLCKVVIHGGPVPGPATAHRGTAWVHVDDLIAAALDADQAATGESIGRAPIDRLAGVRAIPGDAAETGAVSPRNRLYIASRGSYPDEDEIKVRLAQPRDAIQDVAVLPERKEPTMSWPLSVVCQVLRALPGW